MNLPKNTLKILIACYVVCTWLAPVLEHLLEIY